MTGTDAILAQIRSMSYVVKVFRINGTVEMHAVDLACEREPQIARCNDGDGPDEEYRCGRLLAQAVGIVLWDGYTAKTAHLFDANNLNCRITSPIRFRAFLTTRQDFMRRHYGVGRGEILTVIVLVGVAVMVCLYLNQKPQVIEHTVVIQPPAPPPVVQAPPPPAPVEAPPPPPPVVKPVVANAPPPPPPECIIIEANLRDAQTAVIQAQANLDTANKAAVDSFHQTEDYIVAKSNLADAQKARQDAADQLAADITAGADQDHDNDTIRTAAQNLIDAKAKLLSLEEGAATADPIVAEKQEQLKTAIAHVSNLKHQLNDYIANAVATNCAISNCKIDLAAIDTNSSTIFVQLTPATQNSPGAVTDAAMNAIGQIIEKTLYRSALTWKAAKFTAYTDFQKKRVPVFQLTYLRDAIDAADFTRIDRQHFDNNALMILAQTTWLTRLANEIQGIPAPSPIMRPAMAIGARPTLQYTDSLLIGGYARTDGTMCPTSYIRESYTEDVPVTPAPVPNRTAQTPNSPLFTNDNPMILRGP
jgi:hypothetical protein